MSLGKRIAYVRKRLELNQKDFAEKLGVSQQQISFYENERARCDNETLIKIAKIGGVSIDWLLTGADKVFTLHNEYSTLLSSGSSLNGKVIPLVNTVAAGVSPYHGIREEDILDWIYVPFKNPGIYALRVEGDSMTSESGRRTIRDGDMVIIDPNQNPINGDVVALVTGNRQLLKAINHKDENTVILSSWNKEYPDITIRPADIEIVKRVMAVIPQILKL